MESCDNLIVFTKLLVIVHGFSQVLKTRRDSGAGNWCSVALLLLVLAEAEASTALP